MGRKLVAAEHASSSSIDDLRAEWRRRWLAGDCVPVEVFLSQHPELVIRDQDVIELIATEIELRRIQGERPDRAEYVGRFPDYVSRLEGCFESKKAPADASCASSRVWTVPGQVLFVPPRRSVRNRRMGTLRRRRPPHRRRMGRLLLRSGGTK